jgi:hypothetical protein
MKEKQIDQLAEAYVVLSKSYDEIVGLPDFDDETVELLKTAHTIAFDHNARRVTREIQEANGPDPGETGSE